MSIRVYLSSLLTISQIVDPADAPPAVQRDQPPNKRLTTYCILFFPQGD